MYLHMIYNSVKNMLLCNSSLVGMNELVEIYEKDDDTPAQATGKLLRKVEEPNSFIVNENSDEQIEPRRYVIGEHCILRVMMKNLSGKRKRRFSELEKQIVSMEHETSFDGNKVVRAKTGSIRKKRAKKEKL